MAALTRDILGFKYYRADTEGGNRQKCEQMIQVKATTRKKEKGKSHCCKKEQSTCEAEVDVITVESLLVFFNTPISLSNKHIKYDKA